MVARRGEEKEKSREAIVVLEKTRSVREEMPILRQSAHSQTQECKLL